MGCRYGLFRTILTKKVLDTSGSNTNTPAEKSIETHLNDYPDKRQQGILPLNRNE